MLVRFVKDLAVVAVVTMVSGIVGAIAVLRARVGAAGRLGQRGCLLRCILGVQQLQQRLRIKAGSKKVRKIKRKQTSL